MADIVVDRGRPLTEKDAREWWGLSEHTAGHLVRLLAAAPGVSVSSGRRTPERNRAVGGVAGSLHLQGRAVDLTGTRRRLEHAAWHAREESRTPGRTGPQEILMESDHLHLGW